MRSLYFLAAIALLAACGSNETADNHGYGWEFDEQAPSGLRVRYAGVTPRIEMSYIDALYAEVSQCTGVPAHGNPLIVFVESDALVMNGNYSAGVIFRDTGLILIDKKAAADYWYLFRSTARHELTHWLLNGVIGDEDHRNHTSVFFASCNPLVA